MKAGACRGPPPIAHGKCSAAVLYGVLAAQPKTYASARAAYQPAGTRRLEQEEKKRRWGVSAAYKFMPVPR